jgi:hypothetical protein
MENTLMLRFNLTWRIALAAGLALVTGSVAAGYLVWQVYATSAAYDRMLGQAEVQHQDRARVIQVDFKKQVQEWKNLLLRGAKRGEFVKYRDSFINEEAKVRDEAKRLLADVADPEADARSRGFSPRTTR